MPAFKMKGRNSNFPFCAEPNLLSHTAHSVARKGVKKRDLSDVELREILCELLPLVRVDHVLPPSSEVLNQVCSVCVERCIISPKGIP